MNATRNVDDVRLRHLSQRWSQRIVTNIGRRWNTYFAYAPDEMPLWVIAIILTRRSRNQRGQKIEKVGASRKVPPKARGY